MTNKSEPAFSGCVSVGPSVDIYSSYDVKQEGLTKREYFAAMAMQGLLSAQSGKCENGGWPIHTQRTAVLIADALIEELNK